MSILSFVRSFAPVMERRELLNVIDQLQLEYDDTLAPILGDVREAFGATPLKSMFARKVETTMRRSINFNSSALDLILHSLENLRGNFEVIRKEVRSLFSIQFTNSNLSFDRANMLKFIEAMAFYIRYGRKFILFMVANEAATLGKATPAKWTPAEHEWIDSNLDQFASLYTTMSLPASELKARLNKASNATVDEATYQLAEQSLGAAKTDPLNMSGFNPSNNPLMLLGKFMAEAQVERYRLAKEEFFGLQLRLQELRDLQKGEGANPVIGKNIQDYERRISSYEFEIKKIEERAGL